MIGVDNRLVWDKICPLFCNQNKWRCKSWWIIRAWAHIFKTSMAIATGLSKWQSEKKMTNFNFLGSGNGFSLACNTIFKQATLKKSLRALRNDSHFFCSNQNQSTHYNGMFLRHSIQYNSLIISYWYTLITPS